MISRCTSLMFTGGVHETAAVASSGAKEEGAAVLSSAGLWERTVGFMGVVCKFIKVLT
jgi:hypothetical protein